MSTSVPGVAGRANDIDLKRRCSLMLIASYQADYTNYANGSASGGTRKEGVAAVVTRGSPVPPEVVTRTFTSSYKEEASVMESALTWTSSNANYLSITILFCTDSKFICEALIPSNPRTSSIHNFINSISSSIFI